MALSIVIKCMCCADTQPLCPLNSQTLTELYSELFEFWKLAMQETTAGYLHGSRIFFVIIIFKHQN